MKMSHHAVRILYDSYLFKSLCLCLSADNRIVCAVIPLLRALTEIEICTRPEFYHGFLIPGETYASVFEVRRIFT
jgi:hypothetical protein